MEKNNKKNVIIIAVLVILIAACVIGYFVLKPKTTKGAKNITVDVILTDGTSTEHKVSTDAEYLGEALAKEGLIQGEDSEYGLYMKTVDGTTVNEDNEEWWCLTKSGESVTTGVDTTPISDGDKFEITLTVGY